MLIEKFGICVAAANKIDNTDADAPIAIEFIFPRTATYKNNLQN